MSVAKNTTKATSIFTAMLFLFGQLVWPTQGIGALAVPPEIGTIKEITSGRGPLLIHIEAAHGNYEAQKNIELILKHLHQELELDAIFVEGSATKLEPEMLRFFEQDMELTDRILDALTKKALVKGVELFLVHKNGIDAQGIEDWDLYQQNRKDFKTVLKAQKRSSHFLKQMDKEIHRLTSFYVNSALRDFLERASDYESGQLALAPWLEELKKQAKTNLRIDLEDPAYQIDWPMLIRMYQIKAFGERMNSDVLEVERDAFLRQIKPFLKGDKGKGIYEQIVNLLEDSEYNPSLAPTETSLLFESMAALLPGDFNYHDFPNLNYYIGDLILRHELRTDQLLSETIKMKDRISQALARTQKERQVVALFEDYRLLKKLFNLMLTPEDYDQIRARENVLHPAEVFRRISRVNDEGRVKAAEFLGLEEFDALYQNALRFYEGAKKRDLVMIENVEDAMERQNISNAVVITGGFHAKPFQDHFERTGRRYMRFQPKMNEAQGRKAYIHAVLENDQLFKQETIEQVFLKDSNPAFTAPLVAAEMVRVMGPTISELVGEFVSVHSQGVTFHQGGLYQIPVDVALQGRERTVGAATIRAEVRARTKKMGKLPLQFEFLEGRHMLAGDLGRDDMVELVGPEVRVEPLIELPDLLQVARKAQRGGNIFPAASNSDFEFQVIDEGNSSERLILRDVSSARAWTLVDGGGTRMALGDFAQSVSRVFDVSSRDANGDVMVVYEMQSFPHTDGTRQFDVAIQKLHSNGTLGDVTFIQNGGDSRYVLPLNFIWQTHSALQKISFAPDSHLIVEALAQHGDGTEIENATTVHWVTQRVIHSSSSVVSNGRNFVRFADASLAIHTDRVRFENTARVYSTSQGLDQMSILRLVNLGAGSLSSSPEITYINTFDVPGGNPVIVMGFRDEPWYAHTIVLDPVTDAQHRITSGAAISDISVNNGVVEFLIHTLEGTRITETFKLNDMNRIPRLKSGWPRKLDDRIRGSAAVADLTGNGTLEVIVGTSENGLFILNLDGIPVLNSPYAVHGNIISSPLVVDFDHDGDLEIFVSANRGLEGRIYGFHTDGTDVAGFPINTGGPVFGAPAAGDLNKDGQVEIVMTSNDEHIYVVNSDGTLLGWPKEIPEHPTDKTLRPRMNGSPMIADLDGDSTNEVIVAADYQIAVFRGDGSLYWRETLPGRVFGNGAVGDVNGDGVMEIFVNTVVGSGQDLESFIYAFQFDGRPLPGWPVTDGGALIERDVILANLDSDSNLEIYYEHDGGKRTLRNDDGTLVLSWPITIPEDPQFEPSGSIVVDVNGDGALEILTSGIDAQLDRGGSLLGLTQALYSDGTPVFGFPQYWSTAEMYAAPVVADLEGDGTFELIVSNMDGLIYMYTLPQATNEVSIWHTGRGNNQRTGTYEDRAEPPRVATRLMADANGDGRVSHVDLLMVASNWHKLGDWEDGDFTGDGFINDKDLAILAGNWLASLETEPEPRPLLKRTSRRSELRTAHQFMARPGVLPVTEHYRNWVIALHLILELEAKGEEAASYIVAFAFSLFTGKEAYGERVDPEKAYPKPPVYSKEERGIFAPVSDLVLAPSEKERLLMIYFDRMPGRELELRSLLKRAIQNKNLAISLFINATSGEVNSLRDPLKAYAEANLGVFPAENFKLISTPSKRTLFHQVRVLMDQVPGRLSALIARDASLLGDRVQFQENLIYFAGSRSDAYFDDPTYLPASAIALDATVLLEEIPEAYFYNIQTAVTLGFAHHLSLLMDRLQAALSIQRSA